jgi:hypothetical protein
VQDGPVGQHRLEPEAKVAGIAIAQHAHAAGIGGEIAADAAGAFGGERQRKEPSRCPCRGLQLGEHAAGLGDEHVSGRIEAADAPHALERQQHGDRPLAHHLPADEAGAAAPGDDPDARLGAEPDGARRLLGRARPDERGGTPAPEAPRFLQMARLGLGNHIRAELRHKAGGETRIGRAELRRHRGHCGDRRAAGHRAGGRASGR